MLTSRLRAEQGIALFTTIVLTAVMLILGTAILGVVVTQAQQTTKERGGESAFNLAEAALNSEAFLLGRNWPTTPVGGTCGDTTNTMTGTLATPAALTSLTQQLQSILSQTYNGSGDSTASQWHVSACYEGSPAQDSWKSTLLNGVAYDANAALSGPRRMWVRAEATVDGHKRAVVGLVQAGKQPVFPSNLAVVAGKMGSDVTTTTGQILTSGVQGSLLTSLLGSSGEMISGNVGLRCSLLDQTELLGCLSGLYKATSITTVAPLLQSNNFVDFGSTQTISTEQVALLRQQAKTSNTYYPNSTAIAGGGGVANGASCLPTSPTPAGKVIFIEQVGDGTGHCVIDASANPSAAAVVVGSGGVRVCYNAGCTNPTAANGGTFTGVIYALHRKSPLQNNWADVRVEGNTKVVGGVFTDDDASASTGNTHGFVDVIPTTSLASAIANLPICKNILTKLVCSLTSTLTGTVDHLLTALGISAGDLAGALLPQLNANLPAITYNSATVSALTTMGDSALVPGTFREIAPKY